jgi:metal-dependent hydrolase (beta-lactamase superfamily II)
MYLVKECVDFNKVIITHHDLDHFVGLADMVNASNHPIEVMTHEDDKHIHSGRKALVKLNANFPNNFP